MAQLRPTPHQRQTIERQLEKINWTKVRVPKTWPPTVNKTLSNMMKHCEDYIGPGRIEPNRWSDDLDDCWYVFAWAGYWNFYFKKPQDATAFILKWAI